jgi:hypothetical protein
MTEECMTSGIMWCFAVFGGLWMLFMVVVGLAFLGAWIVDIIKRIRLVRRIAGRVG